MPTDKPQTSAAEIHSAIDRALEQFEVFHNQVLVAIWLRSEKTAGGLILPDSVRDEDKWQGKVGLVLKKGPMAFKSDSRNNFEGQDVAVDDWIMYRVSDGFPVDIANVHCRLIEDIHIKARVATPEIIW